VEIFVALVVVGAVAWFVSSRRKQEQQQRREDLSFWETVDSKPPHVLTWRVHFPTMTMVATFRVTDHPEERHEPRSYVLKQSERGWRMKLTEESYRADLAEARELATTAAGKAFGADRLRELEAGNKWKPVPVEGFSGLDTAHQRYIRQG